MLLAEHSRHTTTLAATSETVVDALYGLVSTVDGAGLRRSVLAGKRAAHRLEALPWDAARTTRITDLLTPEPAHALAAYIDAARNRSDVYARLDACMEAERENALDHLNGAVTEAGFIESLAVAAPDWVRHSRPHQRRQVSPRDVRTLLSYIARASVKTSPFSGLTTVGVAGSTGSARGRSRVSAAVAVQALEALARDPDTAGLLHYRTCPIRPGGPTAPDGLALLDEVVMARGIIWRDSRVATADHARPWITRLDDPSESIDLELAGLLERLGGADPFRRFVRLLDCGVLRVRVPWSRGQDPLRVLAAVVADSPGPVSGPELDATAQWGAGTATQDIGARMSESTATKLRALASRHDSPSGVIYEDRETSLELPDPRTVATVVADLDQLAEQMRPSIFRSHIYDLLVQRFVTELGPGSTTTDPLGFLMRASVERDTDPVMRQAHRDDLVSRADPGDRAWLPVGPTSAPPSAGVMFQVAAESLDAVYSGRHRTVINHFGSGSGAIFARFARLLGDDFRTRLAEHVRRTWGREECRELTVWADCNTVQAECSGILPPLLVPGEPPARDGLDLADCLLTHDRASNTLSLSTRESTPFGLAYLGLTPKHLLQGYLQLVAVLADPWINASDDSDYTLTKQATLLPLCGDDVASLPRIQHGRLVTRRASWVMPVVALPAAADSDADVVLAAVALRDQHQMPEEVFVHQLGGFGALMGGTRKPLWLSWASPTSIRVMLAQLDKATTHLRVVESLPTREEYPQTDRDHRSVATEHVALLTWPRTGGV